MKLAGKEIIAHRIAELIKETSSKKKTSTIPLLWKLDLTRGLLRRGNVILGLA